MLHQILVPLDGSTLGERALPYAESLARASQARLILLRAVEAHALTGRGRAEARAAAMLEAESYLEGIATPLRERGLTVDLALPYGGAADAIADEATLRGVDLVAMATHGRGGLGRFVYGSVAERVLHELETPLLLVRAWGDPPPAAFAAAPRIVVPLDGSRFAEAALPVARDLAQVLGGQLFLVQALTPPEAMLTAEMAYTDYDPAAELTVARGYLRQFVAEEQAAGRTAQSLVEAGMPSYLIPEIARANHAALIVMATHGRSGFGRAIMGSVADATLRLGNTPLLLVHPPEDEAPVATLATAAQR